MESARPCVEIVGFLFSENANFGPGPEWNDLLIKTMSEAAGAVPEPRGQTQIIPDLDWLG
jgi:hypothetical protein